MGITIGRFFNITNQPAKEHGIIVTIATPSIAICCLKSEALSVSPTITTAQSFSPHAVIRLSKLAIAISHAGIFDSLQSQLTIMA